MSTTQQAVSQPKPKRLSRSRFSLAELVDSRIRHMRTTAQAVSRKSGLNPSIISRILSGSRRTIEHETAVALAKAIEVKWERLYEAMRAGKAKRLEESQSNTSPL